MGRPWGNANPSTGLGEGMVALRKAIQIILSSPTVPDYRCLAQVRKDSAFKRIICCQFFHLLWHLIQMISCLPFNFLNKKLKLKAGLVPEEGGGAPGLGLRAGFLKWPFMSASLISTAPFSKPLLW